jgi:uncharacterized protein YjbI with pentapeptide repeats
MKSSKSILLLIILVLVFVIGYWAITPSTAPVWTGFNPYDATISGPRAKTLWDWLDLLIVPLVLSIGVWFLSSAEKESEKIIELDRQRQNTLDIFVSQVSKLILENNLKSKDVTREIRAIARTYSLGAFRRLDKGRKAEALQFLQEAELISNEPVISLNGANLRDALLDNAELIGAEIKGAYFSNASFKKANLSHTNLCGSDLSFVDFTQATFMNTDLSDIILKYAKLRNVDLTKANLYLANVEGADLRGAKLSEKQYGELAFLDKAKFYKKDLLLKSLKEKKKK